MSNVLSISCPLLSEDSGQEGGDEADTSTLDDEDEYDADDSTDKEVGREDCPIQLSSIGAPIENSHVLEKAGDSASMRRGSADVDMDDAMAGEIPDKQSRRHRSFYDVGTHSGIAAVVDAVGNNSGEHNSYPNIALEVDVVGNGSDECREQANIPTEVHRRSESGAVAAPADIADEVVRSDSGKRIACLNATLKTDFVANNSEERRGRTNVVTDIVADIDMVRNNSGEHIVGSNIAREIHIIGNGPDECREHAEVVAEVHSNSDKHNEVADIPNGNSGAVAYAPRMYMSIFLPSVELTLKLAFQKVLNMFAFDCLREQLANIRNIARTLSRESQLVHDSDALRAVDHFMRTFEGDRFSVDIAHAISQMWPAHRALHSSDKLGVLRRAIQRRRVMLSSAAAWYWLTEVCAARSRALMGRLTSTTNCATPDSSSGWFEQLCLAVYDNVRHRRAACYNSGDYLPHLDEPTSVPFDRPCILDPEVPEVATRNVLAVIRRWLHFPNNKDMVSAYFVICVVGTFRNSDVLLLDGIWETYRSISMSILGKKQRPEDARVSMLQPFAIALRTLPLAHPQSKEAAIMLDFSSAVEQCFPGLRDWTDASIKYLHATQLPNIPASASRTLPSQPIPAPAPPRRSPEAAGLHDILEFVLHLLPIARNETIASPTKLQRLVMNDPDFYLPFRELAPSRQRVTAPGGPFHEQHCNKTGAFASWVIFRALLFNSPVLHQHTRCYFADANAWKVFLRSERFDPTSKESLTHFFNFSCYGSPQDQRKEGADIALKYFAAEENWQKLVAKHGGKPIPFEEFFFWTQGKEERERDAKGKRRFFTIPTKLPLVGGLTGYLLTADAVYAGKVACPTVEDMGRVVHFNGLGSLKGLILSNQVSSSVPSEAEVLDGFKRVYNYLEQELSEEVRSYVRFDPVMVEHLLCKYQRTRKAH